MYLSPHFDDAALCAGGLIYDQYQAGESVEIWTIMSGIPRGEQLTPYAQVMHQRWSTTSAQQTVQLRREEDRARRAILGATTFHLGFLDAIYRTTAAGEPLYGDPVGAPLHPQDEALVDTIAAEVRRRLEPEDRVVSLLAIGNHADHVLVRRAAEAAGCDLHYVADFPYVINYPETVASSLNGLEPMMLAVSESGVAAWIDAVQAYASQLGAVFGETLPGRIDSALLGASAGLTDVEAGSGNPHHPGPAVSAAPHKAARGAKRDPTPRFARASRPHTGNSGGGTRP